MRLLFVSEEEVAWLYVFVNHVVVVAILQSRCSLQRDASEAVHVAVEFICGECSAPKVFHEFVVTAYASDIHFSEVIDLYDHLESYTRNDLQQFFLHREVWVIDFQHEEFSVVFHEEHLCLSRVVAQASYLSVVCVVYFKRIGVDAIVVRRLRLSIVVHTSSDVEHGIGMREGNICRVVELRVGS